MSLIIGKVNECCPRALNREINIANGKFITKKMLR